MKELPSPLLAVTERGSDGSADAAALRLVATVDRLLGAGIRWIWFRERDMPPEPRRALARLVGERVRAQGGALTIGGDPTLAAELGARGVHLPGGATAADIARAREILPKGLLGVSAHSVAEVEAMARSGADYVTLSPIFATASKPGYGPALGVGSLARATMYGLPLVALGGITADRIETCRRAGAAGIAVMGPLMRGPDPGATAQIFLALAGGEPERP